MFLQHISAKNRRPSEPLLSAPPAWLWSRSRDDERWPERSMANLWHVLGMTLWTLRLRRFSAHKNILYYIYITVYCNTLWLMKHMRESRHITWASNDEHQGTLSPNQSHWHKGSLSRWWKIFHLFFIWDFIGLGWGPLDVLAYIMIVSWSGFGFPRQPGESGDVHVFFII